MAQRKSRQEIPENLAAEVLFQSNRICCVCREPGKPVQIHHIDENPGNNVAENLAVLCFDCHRDTQIRGGFDRKLSAAQVARYRDDWHQIVEDNRREKEGNGSTAIPIKRGCYAELGENMRIALIISAPIAFSLAVSILLYLLSRPAEGIQWPFGARTTPDVSAIVIRVVA